MSQREPTYDELAAKRAEEWRVAQATAARGNAELHAKLLAMPDVSGAPSPDLAWSHHDLSCNTCGEQTFYVQRWVTVNGIRHRAEVRCASGGHVGTWDWNEKRWID